MKVLISRHVASEGPGYLADYLTRQGIEFDIVKIDAGQPYPKSIADYAGFVFMGGPMSVNDDLPWIPLALELIRNAVDAGVPVLGHCLGGQLISKALGGEVTRNRVKEIGWLPVNVVESPGARDWLREFPAEFEVFHWHGETFSIPPGATRILSSRDCANQAFVIGNTLALQCHIEMTADMVRAWARGGREEITQHRGATVQDEAAMTSDLDARIGSLHRIADPIYDRWLRGLAGAAVR